jgi:hypothetical protein
MERVSFLAAVLPVEGVPELADGFVGPNLYELGRTVGDLHTYLDNELCELMISARRMPGDSFGFPRRIASRHVDSSAANAIAHLARTGMMPYGLEVTGRWKGSEKPARLDLLQYDTVMPVEDALVKIRKNLYDRLWSFYTGWERGQTTRSGRLVRTRGQCDIFWPYWTEICRYLLCDAPVNVTASHWKGMNRVVAVVQPDDANLAKQIYPSVFGDPLVRDGPSKRARVSE